MDVRTAVVEGLLHDCIYSISYVQMLGSRLCGALGYVCVALGVACGCGLVGCMWVWPWGLHVGVAG